MRGGMLATNPPGFRLEARIGCLRQAAPILIQPSLACLDSGVTVWDLRLDAAAQQHYSDDEYRREDHHIEPTALADYSAVSHYARTL